jgi:Na+-driven multidrug efflux pump
MITNVGERAGAISNLVKGLFMFYMIPAWGFVQAVNAITSNLIGQNRKDEVFKYALKSAGQIILLMLPFALGCLIFPRQILSLLTNNVELIDDAVNVIRMMSGFILFGSSCSLFYNAYAGTGDTKTAMFIEVSSALIYLAYVIYFIHYKWINVEVVWFSEYLYWIVIGVLSCIWLRKGKWKAMTL